MGYFMRSGEFFLALVCSKDDAPPFSAKYQEELRKFSSQAHASSQRGFAMDSVSGGGGPLGEFFFDNSEAIIAAITTCGVAWLHARLGRKLRLKFGDIVIEANNHKEVEAMLEQVIKFKEKTTPINKEDNKSGEK
jgi:hypothetical protein